MKMSLSFSFYEQAEVRPSCGRLVLFSSGGENAYGVRAVTQGRSCAITLWFTGAVEHAEQVTPVLSKCETRTCIPCVHPCVLFSH